MTVTWAPQVRVWASSTGLDVSRLVPGKDVLVHARRDDALCLPDGVLLDDLLSPAERLRLDAQADAALETWRKRQDEGLTVDGVCLPFVHEIELRADVMLPEVRLVSGLLAALGNDPPRGVLLEGFDPPRIDCLNSVLAERGIQCQTGQLGPAPTYPVTFPRHMAKGVSRLLREARETFGAPARIRGGALIIPHWHLLPLWPRLARDGLEPVLDPSNLPALSLAALARSARRGGWIGHPGERTRRSSRRAVGRALSKVEPDRSTGPLERLLEHRAVRLLASVALDDLAQARAFRDAFRRGLRTAVTLSDAAPISRVLGVAAREHGRPLVHVQHGFLSVIPGGFRNPPTWSDGMVADRVAVWAERDVDHLSARAPGQVTHTGNPAAGELVPRAQHRAPGALLLLAQPVGILSCAVDVRATARHLDAALAAISKAGASIPVIYRPHPIDRAPAIAALEALDHRGLDVRVDTERPISDALADAVVCIGSTSTATLQAAAAGVPTVFLKTAGADAEPPLDGRGSFPVAKSKEELAELLEVLMTAEEPPGRREALVALGVEPGALDRVADLIADAG